MAERANIFEKPRFGLEATAGAPVATTHILQSLTVVPSPKLPRTLVRAAGKKRPVGVTSAKQWTELSLDGVTCFHDLAYLLNSAVCMATSAAGGASGVTRLSWRSNEDAQDSVATYTIEMGSTAGAAKVPGVFINDLSLSYSKGEIKTSAKATGRRYDEGITLTPNPVNEAMVPAAPDEVSIFVSDTLAGLTATEARMKRCVSANIGISGRQTPVFTLDDAEGSFTTSVERGYDAKGQIVLMQNSQGIQLMSNMRLQQTFFVRIEIVSKQTIVTGQPYRLRVTFPCVVSDTNRGDTDDIFAGTYDLETIAVDNAFGAGLHGSMLVEMDVPTAFATSLAVAGTAVTGYDPSVAGARTEALAEDTTAQTTTQSAGTSGQYA